MTSETSRIIRRRAPADAGDTLGLNVLHSPDPQLAGAAIALGGERLLGRKGAGPTAIEIDDRRISRQHARLRPKGARCEVEDLGSTNGVFVGGERIARAELGPMDIVRFGDTVVEW